MKRRTFALSGAAALGLAGRATAASPIVIKFSHVVTDTAPKGEAALRFKELAEKYTNGGVKIEVYPNSTLYKDAEELEALQLGAVQMLAPSTAKFAPLGVKQFEVLDLPFLFPNAETYQKVVDGPFGQGLFKRLEGKGITGLQYWDNGFYLISANRPIIKPDDLKGLKMRISGSKIDDETLRLMGALPQIMAFSELYQALQSGVVDGAQNTASNYTTQKLYEVQTDISTLYHVHLQYAVIVNKRFWDGLPEPIRKPLEQAMAESTKYNNGIAGKLNDDALATMRKSPKCTVHDITPEQRQVWRKATEPVYTSAADRVGKDTIAEALKAVESAAKA